LPQLIMRDWGAHSIRCPNPGVALIVEISDPPLAPLTPQRMGIWLPEGVRLGAREACRLKQGESCDPHARLRPCAAGSMAHTVLVGP
jgi:hypothetical protein